MLDRLGVFARVFESQGELIVGDRVVRLELEGTLKIGDGLIGFPSTQGC